MRAFKEKSMRFTQHKNNNRKKNKIVKTDEASMLYKKKKKMGSNPNDRNRKGSYLASD